jgi:hypothetical protein
MRQIIVHDTDDYREGPSLDIIDEDDTEVDYDPDCVYYRLNLDTTDNEINLYYVCLGCCDFEYDLVKLGDFPNSKKAFEYAQQQFTLYNKCSPFVQTDLTCAYHPIGYRPEIIVPIDMICKIPKSEYKNSGGPEFLILADNDVSIAYSLNPTSVWPKESNILD